MEVVKIFSLFVIALYAKEANSCCMMEKFEANQAALVSLPNTPLTMMHSHVVFDNTAAKLYVLSNINGQMSKQIQDRKAATLYMFNDTYCTKYNMAAYQDTGCVPGNVCTLVSNDTLGTGSSEIPVFTYQCGSPDYTLTFDQNCAPVATYIKNFHLADGIPDTTLFIQYSDVKQGISDMSVFTPPTHCHHPGLALHTAPDPVGKRFVPAMPFFSL